MPSRQRFVCGERFTEADLRLFPTISRFDAVYTTLFKCCKKRIADYPHLQASAARPGGARSLARSVLLHFPKPSCHHAAACCILAIVVTMLHPS